MKRDREVTKVIFKKAYDRGSKEWYVVAFFPGVTANRGNVMSYVHDGQHGEASYDFYVACRPAVRKEYLPLKRELEKFYGYRFKVVRRMTQKDLDQSWKYVTDKEIQKGEGEC